MNEFDPFGFTKNAYENELAAVKQLARETHVIYEQIKRDGCDQTPGGKRKFVAESARAGHVVSMNSLLVKLFPAQKKKLDTLTEVVRSWAWVVGENCAKHSAPYDLIGTKLCVESDSSQIRARLFSIKGNICRKLKTRWDIDCDDLYVSAGPAPVKPSVAHQRPQRQYARVTVTEQDVAEKLNALDRLAKSIPPDPEGQNYKCTLLEDNPKAARALAHLMAFFEKRFPENRNK